MKYKRKAPTVWIDLYDPEFDQADGWDYFTGGMLGYSKYIGTRMKDETDLQEPSGNKRPFILCGTQKQYLDNISNADIGRKYILTKEDGSKEVIDEVTKCVCYEEVDD